MLLALALIFPLTACKDELPASMNPKTVDVARNVAAVASNSNGQIIYQATCAACHASGMMHAPKLGDKDAWGDLIAEGVETLTENTISGKGSMPPKGGNPRLSNADIRAAVEYMVEQSR
jgi:cytochrome c5